MTKRVIDGDTFIDMFGQSTRLTGYDAWELGEPGGALAANALVRDMDPNSVQSSGGVDRYGRQLASASTHGGQPLDVHMVQSGYAVPTRWSDQAVHNAEATSVYRSAFGPSPWDGPEVRQDRERLQAERGAAGGFQMRSVVDAMPAMGPDQRGPWARGIARGTSMMGVQTGGVAHWFGEMLGSEGLQEWGIDTIERGLHAAEQSPADVASYKDVNGFGSGAAYARDVVAEQIPNFITTLIGAGIGSAAARGVAHQMSRDLVRRHGEQRAAAMIRDLNTKAMQRGAITGVTASSAGANLGMIEQEHVTNDLGSSGELGGAAALVAGSLDGFVVAKLFAPLFKALEPGVSTPGMQRTIQRRMQEFSQEMAKGVAMGASMEAVINPAQESLAMAVRSVNDPNFAMLSEAQREEVIDRLLEATFKGAAAGGALGGLTGGAQGLRVAMSPDQPAPADLQQPPVASQQPPVASQQPPAGPPVPPNLFGPPQPPAGPPVPGAATAPQSTSTQPNPTEPQTVPEPVSQVVAQLDDLRANGGVRYFERKAFDALPQDSRKGLATFGGPDSGVYVVRRGDVATSRTQIEAINNIPDPRQRDAARGDLLGYVQSKEEATAGIPEVVQGRDAQGHVIYEQVVDGSNPDATATAIEATEQRPGVETVESTTPQAVLDERIAGSAQDEVVTTDQLVDGGDVAAAAQPEAPTVERGLQGVVAVPDDPALRKGSPTGDSKDARMRQVANGAIVELDGRKRLSSSARTLREVGARDEDSTVVMLARNGSLQGKPLRAETKADIDDAVTVPGFEKFVVGDMPGVDSAFINYLTEKGYPFEVYHTGAAPRIDLSGVQPKPEAPAAQPEVPGVAQPHGRLTTQGRPAVKRETPPPAPTRIGTQTGDMPFKTKIAAKAQATRRTNTEGVQYEAFSDGDGWWIRPTKQPETEPSRPRLFVDPTTKKPFTNKEAAQRHLKQLKNSPENENLRLETIARGGEFFITDKGLPDRKTDVTRDQVVESLLSSIKTQRVSVGDQGELFTHPVNQVPRSEPTPNERAQAVKTTTRDAEAHRAEAEQEASRWDEADAARESLYDSQVEVMAGHTGDAAATITVARIPESGGNYGTVRAALSRLYTPEQIQELTGLSESPLHDKRGQAITGLTLRQDAELGTVTESVVSEAQLFDTLTTALYQARIGSRMGGRAKLLNLRFQMPPDDSGKARTIELHARALVDQGRKMRQEVGVPSPEDMGAAVFDMVGVLQDRFGLEFTGGYTLNEKGEASRTSEGEPWAASIGYNGDRSMVVSMSGAIYAARARGKSVSKGTELHNQAQSELEDLLRFMEQDGEGGSPIANRVREALEDGTQQDHVDLARELSLEAHGTLGDMIATAMEGAGGEVQSALESSELVDNVDSGSDSTSHRLPTDLETAIQARSRTPIPGLPGVDAGTATLATAGVERVATFQRKPGARSEVGIQYLVAHAQKLMGGLTSVPMEERSETAPRGDSLQRMVADPAGGVRRAGQWSGLADVSPLGTEHTLSSLTKAVRDEVQQLEAAMKREYSLHDLPAAKTLASAQKQFDALADAARTPAWRAAGRTHADLQAALDRLNQQKYDEQILAQRAETSRKPEADSRLSGEKSQSRKEVRSLRQKGEERAAQGVTAYKPLGQALVELIQGARSDVMVPLAEAAERILRSVGFNHHVQVVDNASLDALVAGLRDEIRSGLTTKQKDALKNHRDDPDVWQRAAKQALSKRATAIGHAIVSINKAADGVSGVVADLQGGKLDTQGALTRLEEIRSAFVGKKDEGKLLGSTATVATDIGRLIAALQSGHGLGRTAPAATRSMETARQSEVDTKVRLLEALASIDTLRQINAAKTDGQAAWVVYNQNSVDGSLNVPVVYLDHTRIKTPQARLRALAHELGHLVMRAEVESKGGVIYEALWEQFKKAAKKEGVDLTTMDADQQATVFAEWFADSFADYVMADPARAHLEDVKGRTYSAPFQKLAKKLRDVWNAARKFAGLQDSFSHFMQALALRRDAMLNENRAARTKMEHHAKMAFPNRYQEALAELSSQISSLPKNQNGLPDYHNLTVWNSPRGKAVKRKVADVAKPGVAILNAAWELTLQPNANWLDSHNASGHRMDFHKFPYERATKTPVPLLIRMALSKFDSKLHDIAEGLGFKQERHMGLLKRWGRNNDYVKGLEEAVLTDHLEQNRGWDKTRAYLKKQPGATAKLAAFDKFTAEMDALVDYGNDAGLIVRRLPAYIPLQLDFAAMRRDEGQVIPIITRMLERQEQEKAMEAARRKQYYQVATITEADAHRWLARMETMQNSEQSMDIVDGLHAQFGPGNVNTERRTLSMDDWRSLKPWIERDFLSTSRMAASRMVRRAEWNRRGGYDAREFFFTQEDRDRLAHDPRARQALYHEKAARRKEKEKELLELGISPDSLMQPQIKFLEEARKRVKRGDWTEADFRHYQNRVLPSLMGTLGQNLPPMYRNLADGLNAFQALRLLPLSIFAQFMEPSVTAWRAGDMKLVWETTRKDFALDKASKENLKAMYRAVGILDDDRTSHVLSSYYVDGQYSVSGASRITEAFFRANFMHQWTQTLRYKAARLGEEYIIKHADAARDGNTDSAKLLTHLGLTHQQVQGAIIDRAAGRLDLDQPGMGAALNMFVDEAVMRPSPATRNWWMGHPVGRIFGFLKGFMYAFQNTIVQHIINRVKEGQGFDQKALIAVMVTAPLIAMAIPLTLLGLELRRQVGSLGGDEWFRQLKQDGAWSYFWEGFRRSGGLSLAELPAMTKADLDRGGFIQDAVGGPTVGWVGQATFGGGITDPRWWASSVPVLNQIRPVRESIADSLW